MPWFKVLTLFWNFKGSQRSIWNFSARTTTCSVFSGCRYKGSIQCFRRFYDRYSNCARYNHSLKLSFLVALVLPRRLFVGLCSEAPPSSIVHRGRCDVPSHRNLPLCLARLSSTRRKLESNVLLLPSGFQQKLWSPKFTYLCLCGVGSDHFWQSRPDTVTLPWKVNSYSSLVQNPRLCFNLVWDVNFMKG